MQWRHLPAVAVINAIGRTNADTCVGEDVCKLSRIQWRHLPAVLVVHDTRMSTENTCIYHCVF